MALVVAGVTVAAALAWWWSRGAAGAPDEAVVLALSQVGATEPPAPPEAASSASPPAPQVADAAEASIDPSCPPQWRALAGKLHGAEERVFRRLRPGALAHASQLLSASADPFERVAGRLLAARARDQEQPPDADAYLALVSEALASGEPRISALATQLCGAAPAEHAPACSSISPVRWASVDPDNVQSWLAVAADALDRGDPGAAREALARAAQSPDSRTLWSTLIQLPGTPALQALSPVERQVLAFDMISVASQLNNHGTFAVAILCSDDAVAAPARRDMCSAVASVLIDQGETLLEHGIGVRLARRTGWPPERVEALVEEQKALTEAYGDAMNPVVADGDDNRPMTVADACESYRRAEAMLSLVRSGSEMQIARQALQRRQAASSPG